jgi:hypothetical protein
LFTFCLFVHINSNIISCSYFVASPLNDNENINNVHNIKSEDATGATTQMSSISGVDQVDIIDGKSPTSSSIVVESESSKIERLENELRIAKELIQSLKVERKKLRSDKNDLLQQVKHLCNSLQEKEQELRNFIRKFDQRLRDSESNVAKSSSASDNDHDKWTLIKHAHDEAERSLALAAQLNMKDKQLKRMEQQLLEARRQLSGCISDQENVAIISPSGIGMMNHGCDETEQGMASGNFHHERGSYSADSGMRSSDRESAAGDLNLSDGACDNDILAIDSDSISLISSHHNMNQCKTFSLATKFCIMRR